MFISTLLHLLPLLVACLAAPTEIGLKIEKRAGALPILHLPYGAYQADNLDPNGEIYTFKNIRFAAPPVGNLRWAKPAPPAVETTVQDGSYGPICVQAPIRGIPIQGPGADTPIGMAFNQYLGGIPLPSFVNTSEDCLFLDVYVPKKAIDNPSIRLPVISWFYGGAFTFGGKDQFEPVVPFYKGTGLLQQSGGNVIFVASNYRVGAYGFLAGATMEKDGLPNAGLYDQRAALQWIQDYIGLVGGDKTEVSAWGLSAGAASILHHLVSFGGNQDPLFSKAVLQSPAFAVKLDRKGDLEQTFQKFTSLAGCAGQGVACLRAASAATLKTANTWLNTDVPAGTFAVGPSADGKLIRQHPTLELASGHYWKGITSLILSHVANEAELFVPFTILTDTDFSSFLDSSVPPYARPSGVSAVVEAHYPPIMSGTVHNYTTERDRARALLGEASFQCNVRFLTNAYDGKNYNIQYSVTPPLHGTDLLPTFYDLNLDLSRFGQKTPVPLIPGFGNFAQAYQAYLVSHARTGDPNSFKKPLINLPPGISWPKPGNGGDALTGVLNAGDFGFSLITDQQTKKSICGFWQDVVAALTNLGGYAPPGNVVPTTLVPVPNNPSANYNT